MASCPWCGEAVLSCKCTRKRKRAGRRVPNKNVRGKRWSAKAGGFVPVKNPKSVLSRVKDKIIGVTLGGMRVTAKEMHLIQLAYHEGFEAGRKSRD